MALGKGSSYAYMRPITNIAKHRQLELSAGNFHAFTCSMDNSRN